MSTTDILEGCLERLQSIGLSPVIPIAWPGVNFTPPAEGMWLEAKLFPNEPMDPSWNNDSCTIARGFFQVIVGYRPGTGEIAASTIADAVIAHFAKGTELGPVRVIKKPWRSPAIEDGAKSLIPVTIPYRGFTA